MNDFDPAFEWHFRIIGYSSGGSVTLTKVVGAGGDYAAELEAAHDEVMAVPATQQCYTAGPFRTRRKQTHKGITPRSNDPQGRGTA